MNQFYWSDRHEYERRETMVGVTSTNKICVCCKKYRPTQGSKNVSIKGSRKKLFVCASCVSEGKHLKL